MGLVDKKSEKLFFKFENNSYLCILTVFSDRAGKGCVLDSNNIYGNEKYNPV